jgi:hypothetical protein
MENLALRMRARHGHELPRSVEPHGFVPQGSEVTEIPAGSTTKIKDGIRRVALYRVEECCVVLADIVASCAIPESLGKSIVIRDRRVREAPNLLRVIPSGGAVHPPPMFSYCIGSDQALPAMSLRTIGSATVFLLWVSDSLARYARVAVKAIGEVTSPLDLLLSEVKPPPPDHRPLSRPMVEVHLPPPRAGLA